MFMNTNSPIINNMIGGQQGIYPNGYIPSNNIGNIVGISNQGYNTNYNMYNGMMPNNNMSNMGGYYNNQYNNYYNPYLAQQQQQIRETQMREQMRSQTDILKKISKNINKALNNNIDNMDQHLQRYNPENFYNQGGNNGFYQDEEERIHNKLLNIHFNGIEGNMYSMRHIQANNILYDQEKQKRPDDMTMNEYNRSAMEIINDINQQEARNRQRNLSSLYNSNQYNQLVKMNGHANSYFNSMFNGTAMQQRDMNIDDMEVKLPSHLSQSYQERKKAFFDSIFNSR